MADERAGPGGRFQVRLGDLGVAVLGSAFVLDVARRSRAAWGGGRPDAEHALGLIMLALAVGLALVLAVQAARRLGDRGGAVRVAWGWGLAWRGASVGWLAWSVAELSRALQVDGEAIHFSWTLGMSGGINLSLNPLMTALGMVGVVLAASPLRARPGVARVARRSWPSVVLAGLAGVVIVAAGHGWMPYLVLIAIEAVGHAMTRAPRVSRPLLFDRLAWAGLEALPGLAACLATATWLDDDLRAAATDPAAARAPWSWAGVLLRLASAASAAAGAGYLLLASIPRLSPSLAEGIATLIDPSTTATIVLGFAALAAGIAGRSAARLAVGSGSVERPSVTRPWPRRIAVGLACLALAEVCAAGAQAIYRDLEFRWYIPFSLDAWLGIFRVPTRWLSPSTTTGATSLIDRPVEILVVVASAWLLIRLALVAREGSGRPSAIDVLVSDRLALGRFLGWWAGLTTLMLSAVPVLAVAGVALTHFLIRWVAG